jgi:cytochrome c
MRHVWLVAALLPLTACGDADKDKSAPSADATTTSTAAAVTPTAAMGEQIYKRCFACHTIAAGGKNGIGPNLHGVVGRDVAAVPGFAYSPAMQAKAGVWDAAALDAYLKSPAKALPGNRMAFAGIAEAAEREALILYLAEQK